MKRQILSLRILLLFAVILTVLRAEAVCAAAIDRADGEYSIEVEMTGGSGRASITSPAVLIVEDGRAYARIEWSSSHYDYMIVDGEKYLPVNEEGNSVFEIPILVFDEAMTVIGDTTAMSVPHEVEYELTFHEDSITGGGAATDRTPVIAAILIICAVCVFCVLMVRRNRKRKVPA